MRTHVPYESPESTRKRLARVAELSIHNHKCALRVSSAARSSLDIYIRFNCIAKPVPVLLYTVAVTKFYCCTTIYFFESWGYSSL